MKKFIIIAMILFCCKDSNATSSTQTCSIERVKDGDTVSLSCGSKFNKEIKTVRLLGIDCPETSRNAKCRKEADCEEQIPKGLKAKARMKELLTSTVTYQYVKKDVYKRDLGYVYDSNGNDVGLVLLKENLCKDYSYKYPHPKMEEYKNASKNNR